MPCLFFAVALLQIVAVVVASGKTLGGSFKSFCVLQEEGQVFCFGHNVQGTLGTGDYSDAAFPRQMLLGQEEVAMDISVGHLHTCVVVVMGGSGESAARVKCTGSNVYGQLGANSTAWFSNRLVDVVSQKSFVQVFAGGTQSCAMTEEGALYCWGFDEDGAVGSNLGKYKQAMPVPVLGYEQSGVHQVALGEFHTCIIASANGKPYCTGSNTEGQLGDNTRTLRKQMTLVRGNLNAKSIACGWAHTCVVSSSNDQVHCWGSNLMGQLGSTATLGAESLVPVRAQLLGVNDGIAGVMAGYANTFVILAANASVLAFGDNEYAQLATGSLNAERTAVIRSFGLGRIGVSEVRGGIYSTCAKFADGQVQCAGLDSYGQLGNNHVFGDNSMTLVNISIITTTTTPTPTPSSSDAHQLELSMGLLLVIASLNF